MSDSTSPNDLEGMVRAYADQLRQYAEHFEQRDWNYTRDLGDLRPLRYRDPYERLDKRIRRAVKSVVKPDRLAREMGIRRFGMVRTYLKGDHPQPDGVLDNGGIIVHWEETGEYLQYVQPSVGSLLADWMEAEPRNPCAQAIAAEMKRINDAYGARIEAEGEA